MTLNVLNATIKAAQNVQQNTTSKTANASLALLQAIVTAQTFMLLAPERDITVMMRGFINVLINTEACVLYVLKTLAQAVREDILPKAEFANPAGQVAGIAQAQPIALAAGADIILKTILV